MSGILIEFSKQNQLQYHSKIILFGSTSWKMKSQRLFSPSPDLGDGLIQNIFVRRSDRDSKTIYVC
jgi:hypothetical protein